jgi:hypothetical protein
MRATRAGPRDWSAPGSSGATRRPRPVAGDHSQPYLPDTGPRAGRLRTGSRSCQAPANSAVHAPAATALRAAPTLPPVAPAAGRTKIRLRPPASRWAAVHRASCTSRCAQSWELPPAPTSLSGSSCRCRPCRGPRPGDSRRRAPSAAAARARQCDRPNLSCREPRPNPARA